MALRFSRSDFLAVSDDVAEMIDSGDLDMDADAWGIVSQYAGHGEAREDLFKTYCMCKGL
jgi:hypothetical protein